MDVGSKAVLEGVRRAFRFCEIVSSTVLRDRRRKSGDRLDVWGE